MHRIRVQADRPEIHGSTIPGLAAIVILLALFLAAAGAQAQSIFAAQAVGTTSGQQTVTVTAQVAGTVNTVEVLTAGTAGLDFAAGGGASTCPSDVLTVGATCTQSVTFKPAAAGQRIGAVVLLDITGKVLGTGYISGTGSGGVGVLVPGNVVTVAGVYGEWTSTTESISATLANLDQPSSITFDGAGNMYIADSLHNLIRKVTTPVPPAAGNISAFAGTGAAGYTGDTGSAATATLNTPSGIAIDGAGNLYIADTGNNVIRKIAAATGDITTVAGDGTAGYSGDSFAATSAELNQPQGITVDISGNLYIADTANQSIREVSAATGIITTVAGDGTLNPGGNGDGTYTGDAGVATSAGLSLPYAVAFDSAGNMYIPDSGNNVIRKVTAVSGAITPASIISTFAGFVPGTAGYTGDAGLATAATLNTPEGVAFDAAGNLYIADTANAAIRKVNATSGNINTLIKNGGSSTLSSAGVLGTAQVYGPVGLFLDGSADVYFADSLSMIVEEIQSNKAVLNFTATPISVGDQSAPQSQTVENDGNAAFDVSAITPDANAALNAPTTTCATGNLAMDTDCVIGAIFAPSMLSAVGNPLDGNIDVAGNSINSPLDIVLVGNTIIASTTTLISSVNPSLVGQSVTFTATVTAPDAGVTLGGNVTFYDGATMLGTGPVALTAAGTAAYTTTTLTQGIHPITAVYSGDTNQQVQGSTSNTVNQDVQVMAPIVVTSNINPQYYGNPITFTVTVTPPMGDPAVTGVVNILDGVNQIATANLVNNQITFTTSTLAVGPHNITATYTGSPDYATVTGTLVGNPEVVNKALTSTTVVAVPSPGLAGVAEAITATVKVTAGTSTPTGTVTITDTFNGATVTLGTVPLPISGTGIVTINPILAVGTHSIVATYSGDTDDAGSTSAAFPLVIALATTSATVTATPNPALINATITFTATVTGNGVAPTGQVNFFAGTALMGSATLGANGIATFNYAALAAGSYQITAVYVGDANNAGCTSPAITEVVGDIPTVTDLGSSTTTGSNPQVVLVATVLNGIANPTGGTPLPMPTGTVTFTSGTTVLGTVTLDSSGVATLVPTLTAGVQYSIIAAYSGDALHSPSTSAVITVSGTPTDFGITVTPNTVTLAASQNATLSVTLTSNNGFADTIGLGCGSLPAGVTCQFSVPSVVLAANGTQSAQLIIDTNNPLSGGTTAMNSRTGNRGASLAGLSLLSLPFSALLGLIVWRFRKRHATVFTTVLILVLSGAAMLVSGCNGISLSSAAPGTYVIQVIGVGTTTGDNNYQNVTVTITK